MQNQTLVSGGMTTPRERRSGFGALRRFAAQIAAGGRPRHIITVLLILTSSVLNPLAASPVYDDDGKTGPFNTATIYCESVSLRGLPAARREVRRLQLRLGRQ